MGISIPSLCAAAQITEPFGTLTCRPSIVRLTSSSSCSAMICFLAHYRLTEAARRHPARNFRRHGVWSGHSRHISAPAPPPHALDARLAPPDTHAHAHDGY